MPAPATINAPPTGVAGRGGCVGANIGGGMPYAARRIARRRPYVVGGAGRGQVAGRCRPAGGAAGAARPWRRRLPRRGIARRHGGDARWPGARHRRRRLSCRGGRGSGSPAAPRRASSGTPAATGRRGCRWRGRARSDRRAGRSTARASSMSAHGSPSAARRSGTDRTVSSSGWIAGSSSHANGVDTWAPGRARTHQAPNTVLCGAFWLKSMNTRAPRSSFHHLSVIRSGAPQRAPWRRRRRPASCRTSPIPARRGRRRAARDCRSS